MKCTKIVVLFNLFKTLLQCYCIIFGTGERKSYPSADDLFYSFTSTLPLHIGQMAFLWNKKPIIQQIDKHHYTKFLLEYHYLSNLNFKPNNIIMINPDFDSLLARYRCTSCEKCVYTVKSRLFPHLKSLWCIFDSHYHFRYQHFLHQKFWLTMTVVPFHSDRFLLPHRFSLPNPTKPIENKIIRIIKSIWNFICPLLIFKNNFCFSDI